MGKVIKISLCEYIRFKGGTTCCKCWIAISIVPFLLSTIIIKIRAVTAKSQIFQKLWYREFFDVCYSLTGLIADGRSGYFTVCVDLEVIPVMLVKQK